MLRTFFVFSCFSSLFLNLILFPWHLNVRSIPGLSAILWLTVASLSYGLNAAAYDSADLLLVPAYCDIVTKILMGAQMGMAVSMTCYMFQFGDWLCRPDYRSPTVRLEHKPSLHLALCVIAPIVYMALHVAAQGHRFDIVEGVGCIPSTNDSALSFIFIWLPPIVPCCVTGYYAFLVLRYLNCENRVTPAWQTTWEKLDSDLAFTGAPYSSFRITRIAASMTLINLWIGLTPIYPLVIFSTTHFSGFQRPQLSRIDVFVSLSESSPEATAMQLFIWSIPIYSVLFFLANIDRGALKAFPALFRRQVLGQSMMNLDPNPGIDLTTLQRVITRRRFHRRVQRHSRIYDAPVTDEEFDFPFSNSSSPKLDGKHNIELPPMPEEALILAKSYVASRHSTLGRPIRPAPKAAIPEDVSSHPIPQQPRRTFQFHEHRESKRARIRGMTSSRAYGRAINAHIPAAGGNFLNAIPESPIARSLSPISPVRPELARIEIPSPIKSMYAEFIIDGMALDGPYQPLQRQEHGSV